MKNLIIYFSWSGNTEKLVKETNKKFGYDAVKVERAEAYSDDYDTCAYVEAKEEWEKRLHPEIKGVGVDVNTYDRILLFFPIWWYTFPMPIATLIEGLKGYRGEIVAFENSYTNDPKYVENSIKDLKALDGALNVRQGLFNKSTKEHVEFIEKLQ